MKRLKVVDYLTKVRKFQLITTSRYIEQLMAQLLITLQR